MVESVWVERMWDNSGFWLKVGTSERFPNGKAVELHRWRSAEDAGSLDELDLVLGSWGIRRQGPVHENADGKIYVTVARST